MNIYIYLILRMKITKTYCKISKYEKNFKIIRNTITKTKNVNSVANLMNYIDTYNNKWNFGFNKQTILKDTELDFNGIYSRYENKWKNKMSQKNFWT